MTGGEAGHIMLIVDIGLPDVILEEAEYGYADQIRAGYEAAG